METEKKRVAILGCGYMGTALLQAWLRSNGNPSSKYQFSACVRTQQSRQRLQNELGKQSSFVETGCGEEALQHQARHADIIILGCAPDDIKKISWVFRSQWEWRDRIIISLLAGVTHDQLRQELSTDAEVSDNCIDQIDLVRIVRVLPTLGAVIGESVTLIADAAAHPTDPAVAEEVETLFQQLGTVQHVSETIMDEATALGAVCHALSIVAVDTLADAGAADGIPRPLALQLAQQCLRSASGMLSRGWTTSGMKEAMAIPTGITINSILSLEQQARPAIAKSARAAIAYTKTMSKGTS